MASAKPESVQRPESNPGRMSNPKPMAMREAGVSSPNPEPTTASGKIVRGQTGTSGERSERLMRGRNDRAVE